MLFINQAFASEIQADPSQLTEPEYQGSSGFVPIILVFVVFYFFLIRPQQKKVKEHNSMINAISKGDVVITAGGVLGKVKKTHEDDLIDLQITQDSVIQVLRSTIAAKTDKKLSFQESDSKSVKKSAKNKDTKSKKEKK